MADGACVLLVEDDPSLRMLCRLNLELERIPVREAESLEGARAEIAAERPGLVCLDLHLQGCSAEPLLDELCAARIPVVLVTGSADIGSFGDRASAVLEKPFEPAALVEACRRHLMY